MPLIIMKNLKPYSDDTVQISFGDTQRAHNYKIISKTYLRYKDRYQGHGVTGKFKSSDELQDHIEKYIEKKEIAGFIVCQK